VLAIAANLWPNCFSLTSFSVDNVTVTDYTLNAHRLDVSLPTTLTPDSVLTVNLSYKLYLPFLDQTHSLRARIGDKVFFAFLQDYYKQNKGKIAGADDFFHILGEHTNVNYSDIIRGYFKNR